LPGTCNTLSNQYVFTLQCTVYAYVSVLCTNLPQMLRFLFCLTIYTHLYNLCVETCTAQGNSSHHEHTERTTPSCVRNWFLSPELVFIRLCGCMSIFGSMPSIFIFHHHHHQPYVAGIRRFFLRCRIYAHALAYLQLLWWRQTALKVTEVFAKVSRRRVVMILIYLIHLTAGGWTDELENHACGLWSRSRRGNVLHLPRRVGGYVFIKIKKAEVITQN
jgi:hypothetical protein